MTHREAVALAIAGLLTLAVVAVRAVLAMRRRKPGTHRETPPDEWDDASLAALKDPPRVVHAGRPARWPGQPAATLALPAYSQTVPRAPVASLPPWPVQPTLTEGGQPWPASTAKTAPSAVAPAAAPATRTATTTPRAAVAASASRTSPAAADLAVWTPGRIRACEHPACPAPQSHATAGHDRWLVMEGVKGVIFLAKVAAERLPGPGEFRSPAWDVPATGLPDYARAALGHATVDAAVDSIFMRAVAGDA